MSWYRGVATLVMALGILALCIRPLLGGRLESVAVAVIGIVAAVAICITAAVAAGIIP